MHRGLDFAVPAIGGADEANAGGLSVTLHGPASVRRLLGLPWVRQCHDGRTNQRTSGPAKQHLYLRTQPANDLIGGDDPHRRRRPSRYGCWPHGGTHDRAPCPENLPPKVSKLSTGLGNLSHGKTWINFHSYVIGPSANRSDVHTRFVKPVK